MAPIRVSYYSDVLCVWAYVAQRRLDKLVETFGDKIEVDAHFCSVFPDAWGKIEQNWKDRGGFEGFNRHLNEVARDFPDIEINERLWIDTRPRTSASAHLFLKAVEIVELEKFGSTAGPHSYSDRISTRAARQLRRAFFSLGKDIADPQVQIEIAESLGLSGPAIEAKIRGSEAIMQLALDYNLSQKNGVEVSPTFIMNEGRQKLFGNVGYRLLEANIQELLRRPRNGEASWC